MIINFTGQGIITLRVNGVSLCVIYEKISIYNTAF